MKKPRKFVVLAMMICFLSSGSVLAQEQTADKVVHDAEYYIIEAQNGKAWAVEDGKLDQKLAELRKKHGSPPNIIHYMRRARMSTA